ncbi:IS5 family transposase [Pigmentiphaga sp.]|uniref:IS5 family transposase n=1 Tax=Pigmentiphaga sp. TaxID=1977564 RepID=UPI0025D37C84|nr:IS5 family transposase [Pigmentiphaga sp.]
MAERTNADPGLIDGMTADLGGPRTAALLDRLDRAVAWATLVKPIAALPEYRGGEKGGRPAWPAITMLKCVMLAKWFGLSDPQLEECLQDRLSFRRFVGLSLTDATPDETTFVRFRARLREARLERTLFERTTAELDRRGLLVKEGSLVDAMIVEQARGSKRDDGTSTRDPEATFTKKHGETCHGYKGSINADRSALVVDYRFSDAAPHDSNFIDELTRGETKMVVADSAYRSHEREAALEARGVCCAIAFKRQRGQKDLPPPLKRLNRLIASVRAVVEHPFAWMRAMGYRRVRYRGRRRNEVDFALNLIAYNWKRSLSLAAAR